MNGQAILVQNMKLLAERSRLIETIVVEVKGPTNDIERIFFGIPHPHRHQHNWRLIAISSSQRNGQQNRLYALALRDGFDLGKNNRGNTVFIDLDFRVGNFRKRDNITLAVGAIDELRGKTFDPFLLARIFLNDLHSERRFRRCMHTAQKAMQGGCHYLLTLIRTVFGTRLIPQHHAHSALMNLRVIFDL